MPTSYLTLNLTTDHAVPVLPGGGTATVSVTSGASVYYSTDVDITPTHNEGTITAGTPVAFVNPVWLLSAGFSTATVQLDSTSPSAGGGGSLALLSTTTLASTGTFDVSGISGSYNDLVIALIARGTNAASAESPYIVFNADVGSNYNSERILASAGVVSTTQLFGSNGVIIGHIPGNTGFASSFGVVEATIYGYASTTWRKVIQWHSWSEDLNTTNNLFIDRGGAFWTSTAAITRIQIGGNAANLATGSQLRIYGRL